MRSHTRYVQDGVVISLPEDTVIVSKIQLRDAIASRIKNGPQEIDVLHWTTRTALELIGQSGLGIWQINMDICLYRLHSFAQVTVLIILMTVQLMNTAQQSKAWCRYPNFCPISLTDFFAEHLTGRPYFGCSSFVGWCLFLWNLVLHVFVDSLWN